VTKDSEELPHGQVIHWEDTYEMLECRGCETVTLRHKYWFSELPDEVQTAYYPPPVSRPKPPWKYKLPRDFGLLIDEIYAALHSNSRRLAMMGARTLVDIVLLDKVGDVGAFPRKLEQMEHQGFIGRQNREYLAAALDAGSAATHRGYQPKEEELAHVMDIVENLLQAVYVLEDAAAKLRTTTPPRLGKERTR